MKHSVSSGFITVWLPGSEQQSHVTFTGSGAVSSTDWCILLLDTTVQSVNDTLVQKCTVAVKYSLYFSAA